MSRLLLLVVPIAVLVGCKTESPNYCRDGTCTTPPGDGSSGGQCTGDGDCASMPGFPVCDLSLHPGTCKQCTATSHAACMGTTPRCENDACVACVDDKDCGGGVCLPTGDCAASGRVIHAASTSSKMDKCGDPTAAPPTPACSLAGALALASDTKDVIQLDDAGPFTQMGGFTVSNNVTLDARGATLNRGDNGPILTVMGGKSLTLLGGTIQGTAGNTGSGIQCTGATLSANQTTITSNKQFGIDANTCMLAVTGARIENNTSTGIRASGGSVNLIRTWLDTNAGGGIDVNNDAKFIIVGNVFVNNGSTNGIIGGIKVFTSTSGNRLDFNSIAENKAQNMASIAAGITCTADVGFTAKNNIIWSNNSAVPDMAGIQVLGCGYSYSDIGPAITNVPVGNQNIDPQFIDKTADLHLTSTSPFQILQQSDPGTSLSDPKDPAVKDIDGDPRTPPVYVGADQPPKT